MAATFLFILVTNVGRSEIPGFLEDECKRVIALAPDVVSEIDRPGAPYRLIEARCERELS